MLRTLTSLAGAALFAASTALLAQQTTPAPAPKDGSPRYQERGEKFKAVRSKARQACEGKQGEEHRECMEREMCSQAKDPKACHERAEKMKAAHAKALKACEGKKDGERRDCMRHEMCAQAKDPAKCEARRKEGLRRYQEQKKG